MPEAPTIIYQVRLERFRGPHYRDVVESLDGETFEYFDLALALERAREELAARPGPVVSSDGVELWQAHIEASYYADEDGEPLPPMTLEQYGSLEDRGEAELCWVDRDMPWLQQELPPHAPAPEIDPREAPYLPARELVRPSGQ